MNKRKNAAWITICKDFNGQSGETYRTVEALKNKYLNLKRSAKKRFSEEKRNLYGTGGGPLVTVTDTPVDVDMREILSSQITGFDSQFDGDATGIQVPFDAENITVVIEETEKYSLSDEEIPSTSQKQSLLSAEISPSFTMKEDWSKQTVTNLRTPVSQKLSTPGGETNRKRDNFLRTKLADWTKAKQESVNVQQQCLIDQHKRRMKMEEEKHQIDIQQSQEIHQQCIQNNAEEHKMKMEILKLQKDKLLKD